MSFQTKDSGKREDYASGMRRDTQEGKACFHLLVAEGIPYKAQMLTRFAELMERGQVKYGARNWEKANSKEEMDRAKASALRHMFQWFCGEEDEDHAAAVMFNVLFFESTKYKQEAR